MVFILQGGFMQSDKVLRQVIVGKSLGGYWRAGLGSTIII